jgi:adenine-specific DNA-methyltransferase
MRYFGSKVSTIEKIYDLISKRIPSGSFCDPFGGIGSVGSYLKLNNYEVWSGDILKFAHFFQIARIKYSQILHFNNVVNNLGLQNHNDLTNYINSMRPSDGWFVEEYAKKRQYFTIHNARKIQTCRQCIRKWAHNGWLNYDEHAVLLASLINSMDRVANTAGTYYAFLKKWYKKALRDFRFDIIPPVYSKSKNFCFHESAKSLVKRKHFNILYLDPPYNQRSYAHYYHLPETMALEISPKLFGKSGIPINVQTISEFNRPRQAKQALLDVIDNASFDLLVLHYTDDGIIMPQEVRDIFSSFGKIDDVMLTSKGYTTKMKPRNIKHHLYLVQHA